MKWRKPDRWEVVFFVLGTLFLLFAIHQQVWFYHYSMENPNVNDYNNRIDALLKIGRFHEWPKL
jgi:hypothetical protein